MTLASTTQLSKRTIHFYVITVFLIDFRKTSILNKTSKYLKHVNGSGPKCWLSFQKFLKAYKYSVQIKDL